MNNKMKGGIYGLLVGNAVGVPYQLYSPEYMLGLEYIDMMPPPGHKKTYKDVRLGTYSDDGALSLCLLHSLIEFEGLDLENLMTAFQNFRKQGMYAVDHYVFDIERQTALALVAYERGEDLLECGKIIPSGKGNGALMRMLPLAIFYHDLKDDEFIKKAHSQASLTHAHPINGICCSLYGLWARNILHKENDPFNKAVMTLSGIYNEKGNQILHEQILNFTDIQGTSYIVDTLMSARYMIENYHNYHDVIVESVRLGNDTNTTACVAGGVAGLQYGYVGIPKVWLDLLQGKEAVEILLKKFSILFEDE